MEEEKNKQGGVEPPPKWFLELCRRRNALLDNNPRYGKLLDQTIRLKGNGAEMQLGLALAIVDVLRAIQTEKPEAFEALVALVKPKGATRPPDKASPQSLAVLQELWPETVGPDAWPEYAKVLDAAYAETDEGVVLCDPIIYPSRDFVRRWGPFKKKVDGELDRLDRLAAQEAGEEIRRLRAEEAEDTRRKKRGEGEGPSRG
jgi:hypothetical protein